MDTSVPLELLLAILVVFTRVGAFLVVAPPFSSRSIPTRVRVMLAFAISLAIAPAIDVDFARIDTISLSSLAGVIGFQALCGLALGFITLVLFSAIQAAGEFLDLVSMFAMASMLDPISNTQSSVFGRIYLLIGTTLLFSSGGHLVMLRGLLTNFQLLPAGVPDLGGLARVLVHDLSTMVASAFEIAGPVVACLFLADLALGLVSRAVPSLNVFQLSFPVKTLLAVGLASIAITLLPAAVAGTIDSIVAQYRPALDFLGG